MIEENFLTKIRFLICLPYTENHTMRSNSTKPLDLSRLSGYFDGHCKLGFCKFCPHFCKSVQTFHAKEVCSTFRNRPPSKLHFLTGRFLWLQRWNLCVLTEKAAGIFSPPLDVFIPYRQTSVYPSFVRLRRKWVMQLYIKLLRQSLSKRTRVEVLAEHCPKLQCRKRWQRRLW